MSTFDVEAVVAETLEAVSVRPDGDGWVGDAPDWFGDRLFGGFVVAQAVHAATRTAPEGRRIHSLHGYFLRPVVAGVPVSYRIEPVRDGRSFASRDIRASQDGEPVFAALCSFTADTDGYEFELPMAADVPPVERLEVEVGPGPWAEAWLGATPLRPDGTRASTHRGWFKVAAPLPDDRHLHAALVAFISDMTGTGGRPLDLEHDITGMISLDHALWFHREARADEWLFYDVHSLVNTGGRGTLRGVLHDRDGHVVASLAQEMVLRPREGSA